MLGVGRLFPSARLQIVRELFFGEWQARTHRLGAQLYPLYYPARAAVGAAEKARGSGAAGSSSSVSSSPSAKVPVDATLAAAGGAARFCPSPLRMDTCAARAWEKDSEDSSAAGPDRSVSSAATLPLPLPLPMRILEMQNGLPWFCSVNVNNSFALPSL